MMSPLARSGKQASSIPRVHKEERGDTTWGLYLKCWPVWRRVGRKQHPRALGIGNSPQITARNCLTTRDARSVCLKKSLVCGLFPSDPEP
ncbi:hypothetical protein BJX66DRAFT_300229 [Aspergillus keveii]|uniref:Uncharacterized protein n=1 Tax=Aspergillus keveii TaxID=714993 RepID=A0ABR4GAY4_9EURO